MRAPETMRVRLWSSLGLLAGLAFFAVSSFISYANIQSVRDADAAVRATHSMLVALDRLFSTVQDAETGQRGYVLTGKDSYLQPYRQAVTGVGERLEGVRTLTVDDPVQANNLADLRPHVEAKLAELAQTVELRRTQGFAPALAAVSTDAGQQEMQAIRRQIDVMKSEEARQRVLRLEEMAAASRGAVTSSVIAGLIGAGLTIAIFLLVQRNAAIKARQDWLRAGQLGLAEAVRGDKGVEQIGEDALTFLSGYLGFQGAALFKGDGGVFKRVATLGVPGDGDMPGSFTVGDGLLGRVARQGEPLVIEDVPETYLTIGSAFGRAQPRHLVIAPTTADGLVNGVIELGFFDAVPARALELLAEVADSLGIALRSARFRTRLQDALEETQRQKAELQAQSEELRVSNEELEEQGRALKESQARLEQQQVELEQTNSELEEQAQTLEMQRGKLEQSAVSLERKAQELAQASQYKSDFLANMSHELRTPLNSLLILSKLLGDNPDGNLSPDQVKFARTIESSGNDLLTLINDILDLSKIEAGHVKIQSEPLTLQRLMGDLRQIFAPVAEQRGLGFEMVIQPGTPDCIETDRMRIEQVLRNLLSNAFKFTEHGVVRLEITPASEGRLAFAVSDTGIGISPEQQETIFGAFQQADGAISRKYGGTGLGLSISRELARLLGGTIGLASTLGEGSTFTLTVPEIYDAAAVGPISAPALAPRAAEALPMPQEAPRLALRHIAAAVADDRDMLDRTRRLLLVVEDDAPFAQIVCDLSHEMDFQCIIASSAEEAIHLAGEHRPSAIVLDLGLPDQSGLTVLDRLKHDDQTRHIPIHVISASDHAQTALALGAVGYHVKPIRRDDLAEVLGRLQDQLATRMRRVLIVEDDPVQRDAVSRLLLTGDVETVGAGTAAECLEQLDKQTFDCMVLDLTLPDSSGMDLLETLSRNEEKSFPPVIVYTGRELSADEEQRLRRFSSSIIIKGAKSPERLLDEVTLFLHQVVADLPAEQQRMLQKARFRDAALEGRRILIVEDDVRNVYSLTSVLEPRGAKIAIARNGREAIDALDASAGNPAEAVDLVLMDVMMPVMDGLSAAREIRRDPRWKDLPIVMLTAKAMPDDQEKCLAAGANDYMAKPIDVDKLLSLVRVWMPR
ncbi:response regulator [Novosphingobium cyanobacteriorum]|uniref:histidine kinase n=1 Tax=Novosphingobium cyanobacteriorum TaxID=3024215 RepID=A0ABT6CSJ9_9SPHN|nr:response regulator [Novosphingobium cyanobacteriorum]MDF8335762.1 response regulator [Novosphingobium cyanobacteriorum]